MSDARVDGLPAPPRPPAGWAAAPGAWTPTSPEPWSLAVRPGPRALLGVVAVAVANDLAAQARGVGVAAAAVGVLAAVGLGSSGLVANRRAWPPLVAAAVLSAFVAVRAHPALQAVDGVAVFALLALAAAVAQTGNPGDMGLAGLAWRACLSLLHALMGPGAMGHLLAGRRWRVAPLVRGVALALPVLLVVGGLAAAGDALLSRWLEGLASPGWVIQHGLMIVVGAWAMTWLLHAAGGQPVAQEPTGPRLLGRVEACTVLWALVAVFGALALARVTAAAGGAAFVERTVGLTYAEYARSGFFQLLWAAAITLAALLGLRAAVVHPRDRRVVRLAVTVCALAVVVVATAVWRLVLYVDAFGLTLLRLTTILFALWIGLVFVCLGLAFAGVREERQWLVPAALATAMALLAAVNIANPAALVVRVNAGRPLFDAEYALRLPEDAVPALVAALPRLDPSAAGIVRAGLCGWPEDRPATPEGPAAANLARAQARRAVEQLCAD